MNKTYLCGPITGCESTAEVRFPAAGAYLTSEGHDIFDPMTVTSVLPRKRMTLKNYMNLGLFLLDMCNTIALLPGWETHSGCQMELAYAKANGYDVIELTEENIKTGLKILSSKTYGINPKKIKVIIYNGVIQTVLGNDAALQSNLNVELVNFDSEMDDMARYDEEYDEEGLVDIPYTIKDCERHD